MNTNIHMVNDNPFLILCNAVCVSCPKQYQAMYIGKNIYIQRYNIFIEGIRYKISNPMFPILCAFNAHEGKTLTREFLLAYGWGLGNKVSNNVTVAILELRVLLSKQPSLEIVAVRGKGYQMFNKSKWNVK